MRTKITNISRIEVDAFVKKFDNAARITFTRCFHELSISFSYRIERVRKYRYDALESGWQSNHADETTKIVRDCCSPRNARFREISNNVDTSF